MEGTNGISIVIPTLNGGDLFSRCLKAIRQQEFEGPVELLVIDSGSSDQTVPKAREAGAKVIHVAPGEFHHAETRNLALQQVSWDHVVYMVQDAVPADDAWLGNLLRALNDHHVVAAYGRPVPHETAGAYARFAAEGISAYLGTEPLLQTLSGAEAYEQMSFAEAYRVTRLDNVCAIYRREALNGCPFPQVPYAEDMAWALKRLLAGDKILYDPGVVVRHSHERSAAYIFRRHVVDAVYCAEILGKLRCDLAATTVEDLICLTSWVKSRVEAMLACEATIPPREQTGPPKVAERMGLFDYLASTSPPRNRDRQLGAFQPAQGHFSDVGGVRTSMSGLGDEIDYLWNFVKNSYNLGSECGVEDILEKIAAGTLGKYYGDAYAGRAARGTLDPAFTIFIEPHLKGI